MDTSERKEFVGWRAALRLIASAMLVLLLALCVALLLGVFVAKAGGDAERGRIVMAVSFCILVALGCWVLPKSKRDSG